MQLQTTSKFPNEYSDVILIQIDQHLKKLLQKYKLQRGPNFMNHGIEIKPDKVKSTIQLQLQKECQA